MPHPTEAEKIEAATVEHVQAVAPSAADTRGLAYFSLTPRDPFTGPRG